MESQFKPSPLYQFKLGIPVSKVTCRVGFDLVIKKSDNSPACVKPDTAQKLVERGWGMWNIKTAWFEFKGGIDCQKIPWIRELVKSNDTSTLIQSMENGTLVREYFQSHGITLLQMKSFVSAVSNPNSVCGYGTFFFLVPQNDTSKMVELSYQVPTDAQQYDIR
ncbi:MAG TPA: hypothetical protein VGR54_02465 [Nitrosopumilaceae archaeon]|nr:hypothetical protein [Nitrosopumilaceae archaeon]